MLSAKLQSESDKRRRCLSLTRGGTVGSSCGHFQKLKSRAALEKCLNGPVCLPLDALLKPQQVNLARSLEGWRRGGARCLAPRASLCHCARALTHNPPALREIQREDGATHPHQEGGRVRAGIVRSTRGKRE